jgi:uracil-DNA glycosylase family 4
MREQEYLDAIDKAWTHCTRCELHKMRDKIVFHRGDPRADIALVGEAPGAEEDKTGVPFIGRAGKLLDKLVVRAGLTPEDVFILNVVACRPPNNREPRPDELVACSRRWKSMLWMLKPKVLVMLGRTAAMYMSRIPHLSRYHGKVVKVEYLVRDEIVRFPAVPTFHPAHALRTGKGIEEEIVNDLRVAVEVASGKAPKE